jgi:predicted 2-oxoglutarate/Fe(II)-dependent dioxygenase YbiX
MRNCEEVTPPGYWGSGAENIHVVDNFVSPDDLYKIMTYAESIRTWGELDDAWDQRVHSFEMIHSNCEDVADFLKSLTDSIRESISEALYAELTEAAPSIVRWRVGDYQSPHADKQEVDGSPNRYPENDIASIVYLNDDYEGGDIYFPNQDLSLRPSAGSLVFFPGDVNYLHGVTAVKRGVRYTMPNFWSIRSICKFS